MHCFHFSATLPQIFVFYFKFFLKPFNSIHTIYKLSSPADSPRIQSSYYERERLFHFQDLWRERERYRTESVPFKARQWSCYMMNQSISHNIHDRVCLKHFCTKIIFIQIHQPSIAGQGMMTSCISLENWTPAYQLNKNSVGRRVDRLCTYH